MRAGPSPNLLPSGEMNVPLPSGDDAWAECLRDLKRTLEGGSIFVAGRGQRTPVRDPAKQLGDVRQEACEAAFLELSKTISFELMAQAQGRPAAETAQTACCTLGCVRPAGHEGPCIDGELLEIRPEPGSGALDPQMLRELTRRVAAAISVAPGMHAIMKHSLPPSLWQPAFAVCVGSGQVRVLTLAFVGEPVSGDRPSCKSTPYVLRLLTSDLVPAGTGPAPAGYCVRPALEGANTITRHLVDLDQYLFRAAQSGDWAGLVKPVKQAPAPRSGSITPATSMPPPSTPRVQPPAGASEPPRHLGDRAARMRANFERAQSRPAAPSRPTPTADAAPASARGRFPSWTGPARAGQQTPPPTPSISVLADGLSVKSVAGALNNMAATTGKIGNLFARARSPGWLRTGRAREAAAEGDGAPRSQSQQAQPAKRPTTPQKPAARQRVNTARGAAGDLAAVQEAPGERAAGMQVVDRAARMRERIGRAQTSSRRSLETEPLALAGA